MYRRRRCKACGERISTEESYIQLSEPLPTLEELTFALSQGLSLEAISSICRCSEKKLRQLISPARKPLRVKVGKKRKHTKEKVTMDLKVAGSPKELAKKYGVSRQRVYQLMKEFEIKNKLVNPTSFSGGI